MGQSGAEGPQPPRDFDSRPPLPPPPPEEGAEEGAGEAAGAGEAQEAGNVAAAATFELRWFQALVAGFGGTLVGGLIGFPGAPVIGAVSAFAPFWVRGMGSGRPVASAWSALAWVMGCVAAGAGMGAEGAADRFARAVPLAPSYLSLMPLEHLPAALGLARWPSLVPALVIFFVIIGLGRIAQGLGSILVAAVPVAWIAARAARFTETATTQGWDSVTALICSVPPQHVLVLGGSLAVAVVLGDPRPGPHPWRVGHRGQRVFLSGVLAVAVGILGEPLILALWRSLAAL